MPGVTVEDEVGRLILRGYRLLDRSPESARLAPPSRSKAAPILFLLVGIAIGAGGVTLAMRDAAPWMLWVGVGVGLLSVVLFWLSIRTTPIEVFLDPHGKVRHRRVRGPRW